MSFREPSKVLPRLLIGFSVTVGIWIPPRLKQNRWATVPFLRTRDLGLADLKLILAHETSRSSPRRSYLQPWTDVAVPSKSIGTAKSSFCYTLRQLSLRSKDVHEMTDLNFSFYFLLFLLFFIYFFYLLNNLEHITFRIRPPIFR